MRLNRTLEFINQNLTRDLRLWELAQIAGMSPNYFCELFKVSTGLPPYKYILRRRIERAKQYLRDPKITLACAGAAAGFADQSHFTRSSVESWASRQRGSAARLAAQRNPLIVRFHRVWLPNSVRSETAEVPIVCEILLLPR